MDDGMTNECGADEVRKAGTINPEKASPSQFRMTSSGFKIGRCGGKWF
jgi:hypothetical protein